MSDTPNTALEIMQIIAGFLSENMVSLLFLVLLIICRDAISNFISRLTSFSFRNGDSEIGMNAVAPINGNDEKVVKLSNADEKPTNQDEETEKEDKTKEEGWFSEMHTAFENGNLDAAERFFKKYALEENDEVKLEENKAIYLFLKFEKGKDNAAIVELEELARTAKTEESKLNSLTWLSFCLSDSMQYNKEVQIWEKAVDELKSEPLISKAKVYLALAMNKDNNPVQARELLISRLLKVEEENQKANIYEALSKIEESLGNKTISIYCKDKSLEFDPNNRDELFNSAYAASNEDIDDISISNYLRLIRIDRENSTALNNLGVRAQEAGLKIKAIDNYKKSASYENTLAMANQGYLLLDAGFTEEAEEIAKKALESDDTHKNVYRLITAINEKKEEQREKWEKLSEKSLSRQKLIRSYTEQYYLGNPKELEGEWFVKGVTQTKIAVSNHKLEAFWEEPASALGGSKYSVKLIGSVSGSSFSGQYSKKLIGDRPNTLLGLAGNTSNTCIGFVSDSGNKITLIASKVNDDFSLFLSRKSDSSDSRGQSR
ncbi:MAG: tetratricopeptide (TPR) repeat protein [Thalassolituus sp.]|jgi:tetratricopeptide (TPR) repeat protein|tara:strand:+ start:226 stop:1866 length:1641 start_codon:yes stop_codon:yes gene_type:complete